MDSRIDEAIIFVFPHLSFRFLTTTISLVRQKWTSSFHSHLEQRVFNEDELDEIFNLNTGISNKLSSLFVSKCTKLDVERFLPYICSQGYLSSFWILKNHANFKRINTEKTKVFHRSIFILYDRVFKNPSNVNNIDNFNGLLIGIYGLMGDKMNDVVIELVQKGELKILSSLKNYVKDINYGFDDSLSLRMACSFNQLEVVRFLLTQKGVEPSTLDSECLLWATEQGNVEIVVMLLNDGRVNPMAYDSYAYRIAREKYKSTKDENFRKIWELINEQRMERKKELEEITKMLNNRQQQFEKRRTLVLKNLKKLNNVFIPTTVLEKFFQFFSTPKDVLDFILVCKSWKYYVEETAGKDERGLFKHIDFKLSKQIHKAKQTKYTFVHSLMIPKTIMVINFDFLKFFKYLRNVSFFSQKQVDDELLKSLTKNVESLSFNNCANVYGKELKRFGESLKKLQVFRCSHFKSEQFKFLKNLEELICYKCNDLRENDLIHLEKLNKLIICDIRMFSGIVLKDMGENFVEFKLGDSQRIPDVIFQNMKKLRHLEIENCKMIKGTKLPPNLDLKYLKVSWNPSLTDAIFDSTPNLETLELALCDNITISGLRKLTKLTTLNLDFCISLGDNIFEYLPKLEHLEIRECANITGKGFLHLQDLKYLLIFRCTKIKDDKVLLLKNLEEIVLEEIDVMKCVKFGDLKKLKDLTIVNSPKIERDKLKKLGKKINIVYSSKPISAIF